MYNVPDSFYTLEQYWEYLSINECAGYGIRNYPTSGVMGLGCGDYWDQTDRHFLAAAISKAEHRLEADRWLGFPLGRKYYNTRQLEYNDTIMLGKYVRGVGIEAEAFLETATYDLRTANVINDVIEFTIAVDFVDINELIIKYPTTYYTTSCKDYVIKPSCVIIENGYATIQIPRCRLLKPEYFKDYKNDNERPNYETDTNFLDTVDVYRNYLNTSTGANLVWWRHKGQLYCHAGVTLTNQIGVCSDIKQLACAYVKNQRDGFIQLSPATYSDGFSQTSYAVKRKPDGVEVTYMRGYYDRYSEWDEDITRAVVAIAHNNLPQKYCARCELQTKYWEDDNKPIEPPVRLGLGRSTFGLYYAEQIIREFDAKFNSHHGGML